MTSAAVVELQYLLYPCFNASARLVPPDPRSLDVYSGSQHPSNGAAHRQRPRWPLCLRRVSETNGGQWAREWSRVWAAAAAMQVLNTTMGKRRLPREVIDRGLRDRHLDHHRSRETKTFNRDTQGILTYNAYAYPTFVSCTPRLQGPAGCALEEAVATDAL